MNGQTKRSRSDGEEWINLNASGSQGNSASELGQEHRESINEGEERDQEEARSTKRLATGRGWRGTSVSGEEGPEMDAIEEYTFLGMGMSSSTRYTCSESGCGVSYSTERILKAHRKEKHLKPRRYSCRYSGCGSSFTRERDLRGHVRRHHERPEKTIKCPQCESKFRRKGGLNAHVRQQY